MLRPGQANGARPGFIVCHCEILHDRANKSCAVSDYCRDIEEYLTEHDTVHVRTEFINKPNSYDEDKKKAKKYLIGLDSLDPSTLLLETPTPIGFRYDWLVFGGNALSQCYLMQYKLMHYINHSDRGMMLNHLLTFCMMKRNHGTSLHYV
jgi:hypothetical protein